LGPAEDEEWLSQQMKTVSTLSLDQLRTLGDRGKAYGLAHFSKAKGVARIAEMMFEVANGASRSPRKTSP